MNSEEYEARGGGADWTRSTEDSDVFLLRSLQDDVVAIVRVIWKEENTEEDGVINKRLMMKVHQGDMLNIENIMVLLAQHYLSLCPTQNILHPGSSESSVKKKVS